MLSILEWKKNPAKYCDKFWPGWDKKVEEVEKIKPGFRNEMKIVDVGKLPLS